MTTTHPIRRMIADKCGEEKRFAAQRDADRRALHSIRDSLSGVMLAHLDNEIVAWYAPVIRAIAREIDLLERAMENLSENSKVIEYVADRGLLGRTEQFLADNIPQDMGIPAKVIKEKAMSTLDVSMVTVDRAKQNLGIESKKVGAVWLWYWPKEESDLKAEVEEILGED